MKIAAVSCTLPANQISNEEVIDLACYHSQSVFRGDLSSLRAVLRRSLDAVGLQSRFWRQKGERPLDLIERSCNSVTASGIGLKDIDTLIYVGIDRGFVEPANACFIAKRLGIHQARTFDVVDGCMGRCSALQLSQALIERGDARYVLVVSSECSMDEGGVILPKGFTVRDLTELRWKLPAFTVGEAVTVTLLAPSDQPVTFHFSNDSGKADLCTIPL